MAARLTELPEPEELTMIVQFHATLKQLDLVIKVAITKHVPMSKPSPYSKHWWMKELAALKKVKEKLVRRSYERRVMDEDPIHEAFQQARNNYSEAIQTTKAEHWTEWLESLDGEEV